MEQNGLLLAQHRVLTARAARTRCWARQFGLSRTKAAGLIAAGRVHLNHELCMQPAREVTEGVILSARGLGRARLPEVEGVSKKGRRFVKIGLYGR